MSTDQLVEQKIDKTKPGSVLFTQEFADCGTRSAVNTALHRVELSGKISRLARGIYAKPRHSKIAGDVLPTAEEIALAIAKRDKARIIPTGVFALYALGLTTQIPLNVVYLTDGSPRKIKVGKRTILFKKTTPKNLMLKGKISRLVVQALRGIGQRQVTVEEKRQMINLIRQEDWHDLKHDIKLAPRWIAEVMAKGLIR